MQMLAFMGKGVTRQLTVNLGTERDAKSQKTITNVQQEFTALTKSVQDVYDLLVEDADHLLGEGKTFMAAVKDQSNKLQAVITKIKAHTLRVEKTGKCNEPEIKAIVEQELLLLRRAEQVKRFLVNHIIKNEAVGLKESFEMCLSDGWKCSHHVVARVWKAELNTSVLQAQVGLVCYALLPSAETPALIVTLNGAQYAEECAMYILEDCF